MTTDTDHIMAILAAAAQGPEVRAAALRLAMARRAFEVSHETDADRGQRYEEVGAAYHDLLELVEDRFAAAERAEVLS